MASFPNLKTGTVAQYPVRRALTFQNQTVRFVDGREQRHRDSAGPLRRWVIRLDQLDEREIVAIEQFFTVQQGALGDFAFTDPWDGHVYASCSLANHDLQWTSLAEMSGGTSLTIEENRE